ncbi:MAG: hypothetical protein KGL59_08275 [Acidobacteriota bacterium]|nr:hypothetical protein [Acidobacteriota bacterium]
MKTIVNVAAWAIYERILSLGDIPMDARQNSFTLMTFAGLAAFAAGVNFYWTVDDTPLARAMHDHGALFASWTLVQVGALALVTAGILSSPLFFNMARKAFADRRRDVILRLAIPLCAAAALLAWLVSVPVLIHSHWVPTPWDVAGDWTAPADWPSLSTRWILGSVSFTAMIAGLLATAISIRQAVLRTELSEPQRSSFSIPSLLLVGSVAAMTIGVLSWGWFVQQYAPTDFHIRNGGLLSSTNFASWAATSIVLVAAAMMAIKSFRSALSVRTQ